MKKAYGKAVGTAARINRGDILFVAEIEERHINSAQKALKRAADKFPIPCRIFIHKN